jgi:hypothetical protein
MNQELMKMNPGLILCGATVNAQGVITIPNIHEYTRETVNGDLVLRKKNNAPPKHKNEIKKHN